MSTPDNIDPIDVAASYPVTPSAPVGRADATGRPVDPTPVDRPDGAGDRQADVVLSAEQLIAGTEWTVTGGVRFRRRVATYTRTVEVAVRREELQIEVHDVTVREGAWVGTVLDGPAVPPPPLVTGPGVFVLREEVPDVVLRIRPYERVVLTIDRATEQVRVDGTARREQALIDSATDTPQPPRQL